MPKTKRRLTEEEINELREIMENAPQNRKPTLRQLSKYFNVNKPSIIKSLEGWKGNKRVKHRPNKSFFKNESLDYSTDVKLDLQ